MTARYQIIQALVHLQASHLTAPRKSNPGLAIGYKLQAMMTLAMVLFASDIPEAILFVHFIFRAKHVFPLHRYLFIVNADICRFYICSYLPTSQHDVEAVIPALAQLISAQTEPCVGRG
ncbi:hypothetical protein ARMGADRAFT_86261 [Armillaria gallica]|uniref:Uncharacterized protein n=1 Tax=Armillaria gallica TaxID=47427 RepID=A0A2H3CAM8_ARMGA|nr:hypothetical protein ARMGADRAFT_86261 [Armillaria gallica]